MAYFSWGVKVMKELREWIKSIIVAIILALIIRGFVMESFIVEGSSMMPTLTDNERVLVNKVTYKFREPKKGEIIVFPHPVYESNDTILIKRVLGLPGDKIEILQGKLYINGNEIEEDYIINDNQSYGPFSVEDNTVFVLGDNRNNSIDSRHIGFVEIDDIRGKTFFRYWPLTQVRYFR